MILAETQFDLEEYKKQYESKSNYHTIKLPNGLVLKGIFDMSKYIDRYKIPNDLSGKTVLDIGSGNGYFAFEFAKRGANVTTIDSTEAFWDEKLNEIMGTNIVFKKKEFSTLDESFGKFDLVFYSHVLQHNQRRRSRGGRRPSI